MKIAIGSKNQVKIAAVKNVVKHFWPDAEIIAVDVDSGVREQPRSEDEAVNGAKNRARLALERTGADLGFGLEGCTIDTAYGMFLTSCTAVVDNNGVLGVGFGGKMLLPEAVAKEIRKGRELGPVMDELTGEHNIKQKQGAIGIFTNGLMTRTDINEGAVILALARFINPRYYAS